MPTAFILAWVMDEAKDVDGTFDKETAYYEWARAWVRAAIRDNSLRQRNREVWEEAENKSMRLPEEVVELRQRLETLIDVGSSKEDAAILKRASQEPAYIYVLTVLDTLAWVLGEVTTEEFTSDDNEFIYMKRLKELFNRP